MLTTGGMFRVMRKTSLAAFGKMEAARRKDANKRLREGTLSTMQPSKAKKHPRILLKRPPFLYRKAKEMDFDLHRNYWEDYDKRLYQLSLDLNEAVNPARPFPLHFVVIV